MLRTIRQSFRRKKHPKNQETRPHQWQQDEESVRASKCSFHVKYLGSVEVKDSRGMQVCEQAVKQLKAGRKKKIRAVLYVSPDALRVVEDSTKALLLDQTIEKVSFCAPDRNYNRAFSYICRDGTTRRWLCHSFFAMKESGERLSHAVGCAFAACLEKKQKREKETGVTVTYDKNRTTFTREGSFRVQTLTEQQSSLAKPVDPEQVQVQVHNPSALPRPHAPLHLIRQASLRQFGAKKGEETNMNSPFKRSYTVQVNQLPSTLNRQNLQIMNAVPEVEEPFDMNSTSSTHTNTHASNSSDDPFSSAPMPKLGSPLTPKQVNGFDEILKPTTIPLNNTQSAGSALQKSGFTSAGSPVHDTNPWAADTRQQPAALGDASNNLFLMQEQRRKATEADKWLNSIQQQTGSVPMAIATPFSTATQNTNGTDPFNWNNQSSTGFKMNL